MPGIVIVIATFGIWWALLGHTDLLGDEEYVWVIAFFVIGTVVLYVVDEITKR